jgi:hypothetical protein
VAVVVDYTVDSSIPQGVLISGKNSFGIFTDLLSYSTLRLKRKYGTGSFTVQSQFDFRMNVNVILANNLTISTTILSK